jgi:5'-nucleotidase
MAAGPEAERTYLSSASLTALAGIVLALWLGACATTPAPTPQVSVRLLAFNDFHGALKPPPVGIIERDGRMVRAGGAAHFATAIRALGADQPNTIVVGAGDLVGATPLISSLFADEPTLSALDSFGLHYSSVGNHEFDRGTAELRRKQAGGCREVPCTADAAWKGSRFQYLAANVIETATGRPFFPAYRLHEVDGVKLAFVGAVLRDTPSIVPAPAIAGLRFIDEAEAVNALVPQLRAAGARTIVLLIHEGGTTRGAHYNDTACPGFSGGIVPVLAKLDKAVEVVVSGHTHQAYNCRIDGRLVTSAASNGRIITRIDLTLDRNRDGLEASHAENVVVDPERFAADPAMAAEVEQAAVRAAPFENRVVGRIAGEIGHRTERSGEMPIGLVIADAQLAATREAGAQFALMNPGGARAPLLDRRERGEVTYGDIFTVQPFGNIVVTMTLTGAQIVTLLEEQWPAAANQPTRILLPSANFNYAWDARRPVGSRVVPGSVKLDGQPLQPERAYRVTANSFLADGGDGFKGFAKAGERLSGVLDIDALERYINAQSPVPVPRTGRIVRLDPPT